MKVTAAQLEEEFRARFVIAINESVETQDRLRLMIRAMRNQVEVVPEHGECPVCGRKIARPDAHYCWKCGRKFVEHPHHRSGAGNNKEDNNHEHQRTVQQD